MATGTGGLVGRGTMLIEAYQPKSPMATRYLKLNGVDAVAVWDRRDTPEGGWACVSTSGDGTQGWPDGAFRTKREAMKHGRMVATRYGMRFLGHTA